MNVAAIGHNNPPEPMEALKIDLKARHQPILDDARQLVQKAKDDLKPITDDETCGVFSDLVKDITASINKIESARTAEKEPFLAGGRAVDGFFKIVTDSLDKTKRSVNGVITTYLHEKAAQERRRLAAEAEEKRKLSETQLQTAVAMEDVGMTKQADNNFVKAESSMQQAQKLETASQAKPAALSSTRGSSSLAGLRTRWVGTITDINALDLEKLRPFLSLELMAKALNAYVAAGNRELAGARIFEESTATVR